MRTPLLAAIAVPVIAAVTVVASATAGADATVITADVAPATVVVRTTGSTALKASVQVTDQDGVLWADVDLRSATGGDFNYVDNMTGSGEPGPSRWSGSTGFTKWYATGKWYADVYVFSKGGGSTKVTRTFFVKRQTAFTDVNASEPVRAGSRSTISGRLTRLEPAKGMVPFAGKGVQLYFLPRGATKWQLKTTVPTDAKGRFTAALVMSRSGSWQARFPGSTHYAPAMSRADEVDVIAAG